VPIQDSQYRSSAFRFAVIESSRSQQVNGAGRVIRRHSIE
jgi:hypothetical protein